MLLQRTVQSTHCLIPSNLSQLKHVVFSSLALAPRPPCLPHLIEEDYLPEHPKVPSGCPLPLVEKRGVGCPPGMSDPMFISYFHQQHCGQVDVPGGSAVLNVTFNTNSDPVLFLHFGFCFKICQGFLLEYFYC